MFGYAHRGFLECARKIWRDLERHQYLEHLLGSEGSRVEARATGTELQRRLSKLTSLRGMSEDGAMGWAARQSELEGAMSAARDASQQLASGWMRLEDILGNRHIEEEGAPP